MFGWFREKHLDFALNETKTFYIKRVKFVVRKLNPLDYMNGSKVLLKEFDTYKAGKEVEPAIDENRIKKIKEHYADVFMSGVIHPKLTRKADEPYATHVESLFKNWDMCTELYENIMTYTYGKKKIKSILSQNKIF